MIRSIANVNITPSSCVYIVPAVHLAHLLTFHPLLDLVCQHSKARSEQARDRTCVLLSLDIDRMYTIGSYSFGSPLCPRHPRQWVEDSTPR